MLFDSIRRGKAALRNTFGVGRYNIRLNFYCYEISKLNYLRTKTYFFFNYVNLSAITLNNKRFFNFESYETTLFSYSFEKGEQVT
jgi:hypothetical protein